MHNNYIRTIVLKAMDSIEHSPIMKGMSVNILRNDGRIHPAVVANVNHLMKSAIVEWTEDQNSKAKELDYSIIYKLNPHLVRESDESPSLPPIAVKKCSVRPVGRLIPPRISISRRKDGHEERLHSSLNQPPGKVLPRPSFPCRSSLLSHSVVEELPTLNRHKDKRSSLSLMENLSIKKFDHSNLKIPTFHFSQMIQDYRQSVTFKPIIMNENSFQTNLMVCIRKRPLNKNETVRKDIDIVTVPSSDRIVVHEPKLKVDMSAYLVNHEFNFDFVFDENCDNEFVYNVVAKPLMETMFRGGIATCLAYGQTGSGKTHTMGSKFNNDHGIYSMVAADLFQQLSTPENGAKGLFVAISFFEIYGGKVFDLLGGRNTLRVLEDGRQRVQIVGLSLKIVNNLQEVMALIHKGNRKRITGKTSRNVYSSRSHAVFQLTLLSPCKYDKIHGKFSLIDLAGNERGADTSLSDYTTRLEGSEINKSLLALKECIRALGRKGAHLPFRGSTITQLLKDSFLGENSKMCLVAMINPGISSCENTLNTLRYAAMLKDLSQSSDEKLGSHPMDIFEFNDNVEPRPNNNKSATTVLNKDSRENTPNEMRNYELAGKEMLDKFQAWVAYCKKWDSEAFNLFQRKNSRTLSSDEFSHKLQVIVKEQKYILNELEDKIIHFKFCKA